MTHPYNDHSGGAHYIQTGQQWPIPIGGGFNATPRDWPRSARSSSTSPRTGRSRCAARSAAGKPAQLCRRAEFSRPLAGVLDPAAPARRICRLAGPRLRPADDGDRQAGQEGQPLFPRLHRRGAELSDSGPGPARPSMTLDRVAPAADAAGAVRRAAPRRRRRAGTGRARQVPVAGLSRWPLRRETRQALDIRQEPAELRDKYGRNLFGQSVLLARRLVEAGVRYVTVHFDAVDGYSWDSHTHSDDVKKFLLPALDNALASLLEDLSQRGLLDETLVVCLGEMGRTPQATDRWGRGHWSTLFPAVLAGGGIRGGIGLWRQRQGRRLSGRSADEARRPGRHDLPRPRHRPPPAIARRPGPPRHHRRRRPAADRAVRLVDRT